MITPNDILTDAQVAKLAGLSLYTFQSRMAKGFKPGELDFNKARPVRNGRRRWWFRADVEEVLRKRLVAGGADTAAHAPQRNETSA